MSNNFCSIDDVTTSGNNSNRNLLDNLNFMNFHLLQQQNSTIDKNSSSGTSSSPSSSSAAINYHWKQQNQNLDFTNNLISNNCKIVKDLVIPTGRSITGINYKKKLNTTTSLDLSEGMGSQTKTFGNGEAAFSDFGEFSSRDSYFSSSSRNNMSSSNNSFPTIGTFSTLDTVSSSGGNNQSFNNSNDSSSNNHSNNSGNGSGNIFNNSNNLNGSNSFAGVNNTSVNSNGSDQNQGTRETGIIEKLLHSYGFIQCCERQARLFFHFSQFSGNIEHLKIGDPVEFEMTYDRRTGKPIASQVSKIAPEVVLSEERVTGTVTTELKSDKCLTGETTGRISYENRGECFFLPYTKDDVEGNVSLSSGDKVSFQIATNQRGNLGACHIRLENPAHPVKYRGVVCSMKESFGFIERADVVKEIFFHFSEAEISVELRPGDDVEFIIQTRNGKEVACNITRLAPGSVIFEDVGNVVYKGQVLKPLDRNNPMRQNSDPLPGRIRYRAADHSEVEVPFGDKDQKGDFTLRHGDWVQFLLATDRRDQLQRATSISLLDETFEVSGEKREQGCVASLKEGFGFLRCVERNTRLFFHFTEILDTAREICVGDEVEFTVIQDPGSSFSNTRFNAIRIKHLVNGSVLFETLIESNLEGFVTREAPKSPTKSAERTEGGVISYDEGNNKKTIMYFLKDCDKPPRVGDNVRFNICQVKRNKELIAINVQEIYATNDVHQNNSQVFNSGIQRTNSYSSNNNNNSNKNQIHQGFIAVLKDGFGFIETINHDEEIYFHFSNFIGNSNNLELGQEVEYTISTRPNSTTAGSCLPAENVKTLQKGTIQQPKIFENVYNGEVVRPLRCVNPDQSEYCGLIKLSNENGDTMSTHEFGITSLTNKRHLLQKYDVVTFKKDENGRANEISAIRQKKKASVDSIKGQFGFLDFEIEEGRKLFFHMSEVQGNVNNLQTGDMVEFSILTNQRNGKSSGCNVVKISDGTTVRMERLPSRLKVTSFEETGPRIIIIRSPKGPDGTKGFSPSAREARLPGIFVE